MATPEWVKKELRRNYAKATRAGALAERVEPRIAKISYVARDESLRIEMKNGITISLPVRLIPYLKGATTRQIREVEVLGRGGGLHWESLDLDLGVPTLIASAFNCAAWMSEMGRVGGSQTSAAKSAAARKNGRKGGRPRNAAPHTGESRR